MIIAKSLIFRAWTKLMRKTQASVAPPGSFLLALNMNSDDEIATLVSRLGCTLLGSQLVDNKPVLGVHQHIGSSNVLFAVVSDGTNSDIYNVLTGAKSLQDDTKDLKTRFLTYLGATVRTNGTDACKSYTSAGGWITTGGAFDLANMPKFTILIEWKDRVYGAGVTSGILEYSGVADPDTKSISWTVDNGQIEIEQEDNGGDITALAKVPGYLLIFKSRSMKRFNGSSTFPEDMISQGAPCQEAVCQGKGYVGFLNNKGVWLTNGGMPERISKPIQDFIDAIPAANLTSVASWGDDEHMYWSIGNVTVKGTDYTKVVLKFNLLTQTWDIYSYSDLFKIFTQYIDASGNRVIVGGNDDGQVLQIQSGNSDNTQPITWDFQTLDVEISSRGLQKEISRMITYTENVRTGKMLYRANSSKDSDWKPVGTIGDDVSEIDNLQLKGNWFNFKATGTADSGQVKFYGFELPAGSVDVKANVRE